VAVAFVEYERRIHHPSIQRALRTEPKPSPTTTETEDDH